MADWINVKDKLPEVGQKVLVYCKAIPAKKSPICDDGYFKLNYLSAFSKKWDVSTAYGYKITHWMPLPEPPKMENNG